jgi:hypothetical protein
MLFLIFENSHFWEAILAGAVLAGGHGSTTLTRTTACSVPADVVNVIVTDVVESTALLPAVPPAIVQRTPVDASIVIAFPCWS